jgi:hypothetical protein
VVLCPYGCGTHPDSSSVADATGIADPGRFTNPAAFHPADRAPATVGKKTTTATVKEPVAGYDSLKTKEVIV